MNKKASQKKYRSSLKGIETRRAYQRVIQQRYRKRWKNDPEWRDKERAVRRKSYAKMASDPKWRKRKNAKQKKRSAEHRKDPVWRKKQSKRYKELQILKWLRTRGWTLAQYQRMLRNGCVLCGETNKMLMKDHDHKTGLARGLLCHKCNCSLGWYENRKDSINEYLGQ